MAFGGKKPYSTPVDPAIVIDDRNFKDHVKLILPDGMSETGFVPRDRTQQPFCAVGRAVPQDLLYDRKQLKEIFEEQQRKGTSLKQIIDSWNFRGWLKQYNTNYCWCYAVVHAIMIIMGLSGRKIQRLSPYSMACIIKNFRNNGGWGTQALERAISHGCATEDTWPMEKPGMSDAECHRANMNAINNGRQYVAAAAEEAEKVKVTDWYDLRPRNMIEKLSMIARRIPVPSGYNWMGHEMCSIEGIVYANGDIGCGDMDNYGSGGNYNYRALSGSRGSPDDACAPVVTPAG